MPYPNNPETIILQNKYYPKGLTELDIWNYYQSVKPSILKETLNRDLMFLIFTQLNTPIVKRKMGDNMRLHLTEKNYDMVITGRTVGIHSGMGLYESFGIIDVDVTDYDGLREAKKATLNIYDYLMDKVPIIKTVKIRFTGKSSFHLVCDFGKKMKVDVIKFLFEKFLRESPLSKVYSINARKASSGIPNIDLNRNCLRCNYITLNSLSMIGLRCMEVNYRDLLKFNINNARIK